MISMFGGMLVIAMLVGAAVALVSWDVPMSAALATDVAAVSPGCGAVAGAQPEGIRYLLFTRVFKIINKCYKNACTLSNFVIYRLCDRNHNG